ncbi:hypothetical protein BC936DRAFT_137588 [Jimgerdemannia flammicorona]|uniref:Transmembrane protein n=1 Tax=Jimgerdemannia flammicorona TaxID=994334 RepID=A0A433CX05_9FUNG|nr:hypothetical protein BC936DRAFT_137588 [Jimgerdemannia flammicorona]
MSSTSEEKYLQSKVGFGCHNIYEACCNPLFCFLSVSTRSARMANVCSCIFSSLSCNARSSLLSFTLFFSISLITFTIASTLSSFLFFSGGTLCSTSFVRLPC